MNQEALKQILQSFYENRLSHAFLLETNNQEKCLEDLKNVLCEINCEQEFKLNCSECNFCSLLRNEKLPSFSVIRPEGQNIRKNQIMEMKQHFSTKPIYSKYNIYVVLNAEKMNASSANVILKFLEEPEEYILGFFITNNKENIIDTIKSRCQIFSNFYSDSNAIEEDIRMYAIQLLKNIHVDKEFSLISNRYFLDKKLTKDDFQKILRYIIDIYSYFFQLSYQEEINSILYEEVLFLKKKSSDYLLKQINLVKELENQLNYNVNISLLLDRYALETR